MSENKADQEEIAELQRERDELHEELERVKASLRDAVDKGYELKQEVTDLRAKAREVVKYEDNMWSKDRKMCVTSGPLLDALAAACQTEDSDEVDQ